MLRAHDERVSLVRVELDGELTLDEMESVARRAVELRHAPERERVLEEARLVGFPQRALREERSHARDRLRDPGVGACDRDLGVQRPDVRTKCLEVERGGDVDPVEQSACVGDCERRLRGRERVVGEERSRFSRLELDAHRAVGEIGVLREIGLADRSE